MPMPTIHTTKMAAITKARSSIRMATTITTDTTIKTKLMTKLATGPTTAPNVVALRKIRKRSAISP